MALVKSGLKDEARIVYQKAIELKGDDWYSWNDLGVLYYEKGDTDKAIDCYNRSINLKPDDPILYSNLALAFVANGNTKEAMDVITHPLLNDEVRRQVKILLQQNLPNLFEIKL
jgi:Flp pilus assembly protein TadD